MEVWDEREIDFMVEINSIARGAVGSSTLPPASCLVTAKETIIPMPLSGINAPEAILQDIAASEVRERLYGLDYLIGSGCTGAEYPASRVLAEQALVDPEIFRDIHGHFRSFWTAGDLAEAVAVIRQVGIRGSYLSEEQTASRTCTGQPMSGSPSS